MEDLDELEMLAHSLQELAEGYEAAGHENVFQVLDTAADKLRKIYQEKNHV